MLLSLEDLTGFASRGFPREIIKGTRRLADKSLEKFSNALKINGELKPILEDLCRLEH